DELTWPELVLVAAHREARAAAEHEVDLLVLQRLLRMLFDDLAACLARGVGVDAERADVETPAHRVPDEPVGHLDRVQLVEVRDAHRVSSAKRGSERRLSRSGSVARCGSMSVRFVARAVRRCSNAASVLPTRASKHAAL